VEYYEVSQKLGSLSPG